MRKRILIGLHGMAYTGKTTSAYTFAKELDLCMFSFAEPVVRACAGLTAMAQHDFMQLPKDRKIPYFKMTPREMMQQIGRAIRDINPNALIAVLEAEACDTGKNRMHHHLFSGSIVTDVRLPAEAAWVRNQGGIVIHLIRDDAPPTNPDITEQKLPVVSGDIVIKNNGTVEELRHKLITTIQGIRDELYAA